MRRIIQLLFLILVRIFIFSPVVGYSQTNDSNPNVPCPYPNLSKKTSWFTSKPWGNLFLGEWYVKGGPGGISVNSSGTTIYVSAKLNNTDYIERFTSNGTYIGRWQVRDNGGVVSDIAINSAGTTVYATCAKGTSAEHSKYDGESVEYYSPTGTYLGEWGGSGSGAGDFDGIGGISVNSAGTTVYVVDSGNKRVQYFTPTGKYLGQWGKLGEGEVPEWVAINSAGTTIYVTEGNRIQCFSPTGKCLGQWAVDDPGGVAINSAGTTVYAVSNGQIKYFSPIGKYLGYWGNLKILHTDSTDTCSLAGASIGAAIYSTDGYTNTVVYFKAP